MTRYDIAIIGGGIVGLATAMALSARSRRVVVLEAEADVAAHQTGHNSNVVHSGLYYTPGSEKARHCVSGREALYSFCEAHQVPFERCGKVVVAVTPAEVARLDKLAERGRANGLNGVRLLSREALRELEPHAEGLAALHVPETGIVDFVAMAKALARVVQASGSEVTTHARVLECRRETGGFALATPAGAVTAAAVIGCAGLQADRVARLCGLEPDVMTVPFRGEYYELTPDRRHLVRNLIYPTPDPAFPFLGVHLTRTVTGAVEVGPNAVLALRREGYRWTEISAHDVWEMVMHPGVRRFVATHWRTALKESYRSLSRRAFVHSLQRLVPDVRLEDVRPHEAGVRGMAIDRSGRLVDDFTFAQAPGQIHVLNAPSPAATASISIGETIADLAMRQFQQAFGPA